jgi:hypothetical protein
MKRACIECGESYDPAHKKAGGLFTTCDECSHETTSRVVGTMHWDHKTAPSLEVCNPGGTVRHASLVGERKH